MGKTRENVRSLLHALTSWRALIVFPDDEGWGDLYRLLPGRMRVLECTGWHPQDQPCPCKGNDYFNAAAVILE